MKNLTCDMRKECTAPVTHVDNKGYVYCSEHAEERRECRPTRKLRLWEIELLRRDKFILYETVSRQKFMAMYPECR